MADTFARGVRDAVTAALDIRAARLDLSRSESVRGCLAQDATVGDTRVAVTDLSDFATQFADLADLNVMGDAWR